MRRKEIAESAARHAMAPAFSYSFNMAEAHVQSACGAISTATIL
jgi:hypothetical protein